MQIALRKIRDRKQPFEIDEKGVACRGEFWRSGGHEVTIVGKIEGDILLACDRCGENYTETLDEPFRLEVVDRPLKVEESLDVIECADGIVDFDTICHGEIASIESEYHLCPKCRQVEDFEIEL